MKTPIISLSSNEGMITLFENTLYSWCKQLGFFRKEDDDIIAWYPRSYDTGTPSYFSVKNIMNISDNYNSFPTPNKN
jgi:hypothetical protein